MRRATAAFAFVISTLLLVACGGGGSGSSATATPGATGETATTLPNATATASMLGTPGAFASYDNPAFKIELEYPVSWVPDPRASYNACDDSIPEAYRDSRGKEYGYFQVSAIGAPLLSIDEVAKTEASHKLKPYGANWQVVPLTIDGRDARLILRDKPSPAWDDLATLIVPYAEPPIVLRTPSGGERPDSYNYLVVNAHQDYIRSIAQTVKLDEPPTFSHALFLFCGTPIPPPSP